MEWDDASRLLEAGLEEGFDVPGARRDRQRVLDEGQRIELHRPLECHVEQFDASHPIEPEQAEIGSQMAIPRRVPATHHVNETVGVDQTLGELTLRRLVAHEHAAGLLNRCRERHHRGGGRNGLTTRLVDGERLLHRRHAGAHVGRQDPIELGQGALDGRRIGHQTQPASGEQAEGQGQGFVVREDERGEAEPRPQPVSAVTAALGFDRDAEILQHRDVAADRAQIDLQPLGQLRT